MNLDEFVKSQNPPLFFIPAGIHHQVVPESRMLAYPESRMLAYPESRMLAYPESRMLAYLDPRLRGGEGFGDFLRDLQSLENRIPDGWKFLHQKDYAATYSAHTTRGGPRQPYEGHGLFPISRYTARVQRLLVPYYVTLFLPMLILMVMPLVVFWLPLEQVRSRLASLTGALLSILLFHLALTRSYPQVGYLLRIDYFFRLPTQSS